MVYIIIVCSALMLSSFFYNWSLRQINSIQNKKGPKSIANSKRSVCDNCGHELSIIDLLPLLGFIFRRGRCHYCHHKISNLYPLSEIILVIVFIIIYIRADILINHYYQIPLLILAISYMYAAIWVDSITGLIPDIFNFSALFLALLYRLSFANSSVWPHILYSLFIIASLFLLCSLAKERLWGQGDNIYLFSIFLILPQYYYGFWVIAISSWIAVIFLLLKNRFKYNSLRRVKVHYSPYLFLAMIVFIYIYPYKLLW